MSWHVLCTPLVNGQWIYISQGSAATEFRCGGRFYFTVFRSLSTNPKVKELLKSVYICQSYRKNISGTFLWPTVYFGWLNRIIDSVRRLMHAASTAAEDKTDNTFDSPVTRRRRNRQPGATAGGSIKRFPQFPPGVTAAAAKAARAGDVAERRSVSLPVLSNNASTVSAATFNAPVTPRSEVSLQSSPRYGGE